MKMLKLCNDMVINGEIVQKLAIGLGAILLVLAAMMSTNHSRYLAFLATAAFTISVLSNNYTLWITVLALAVLLVNALYIFLVDEAPKVGGTPKDSTRMIVLLNTLPAVVIALVHFFLYSKIAKAIPGVSFQNHDQQQTNEARIRQMSEALTDLVATFHHRTDDKDLVLDDGRKPLGDLQKLVNEVFVLGGGDMNALMGTAVSVFNAYAHETSAQPAMPELPHDIFLKPVGLMSRERRSEVPR